MDPECESQSNTNAPDVNHEAGVDPTIEAPEGADAIFSGESPGRMRNDHELENNGRDVRLMKTVVVHVPPEKVGLIIGRGGRTIKSIQDKTGTRMAVGQDRDSAAEQEDGVLFKTLTIVGTRDAVTHAERLVHALLSKVRDPQGSTTAPPETQTLQEVPSNERSETLQEPAVAEDQNANTRHRRVHRNSLRITVPSMAMGLIIGRGGETIKRIRSHSGAKIQFQPSYSRSTASSDAPVEDHVAIISGSNQQIRYARDLIEDLISSALVSYGSGNGGGRGRRGRRMYQGSGRWDLPEPPHYNEGILPSVSDHTSVGGAPAGEACAPEGATEEEKVTLTREDCETLDKRCENLMEFLHDVTGVQSEWLVVEERDGNEDHQPEDKQLLIVGTRHQINCARDLINQVLNDKDFKVGKPMVEDDYMECPENPHGVKNSYEWGQGEPAGYDWGPPGFYDPGYMPHPRPMINPHLIPPYQYSGYIPPPYGPAYHPPDGMVQMVPILDPSRAEGCIGLDPLRQEPIPPVPILSATIVQSPDPSGQFLGPPVVYFTLPPVPVMNLNQKPCEPDPPVNDHQYQENQDKGNTPSEVQNEDHNQEVKVENSMPEANTDPGPAESPSSTNQEPVPTCPDMRKQEPGPEVQPVTIQQPQPIGIPGSHARIVTFYYDLNVNSVMVMNQWQQY